MSESGDYTTRNWEKVDFKEARKVYDETATRSYHEAQKRKITNKDLLVPRLSTRARQPLIIVPDFTGSMLKWPGPLCAKAVFALDEMKEAYLGADAEIAFVGIGDVYAGDKYPLQARPFTGDVETMKHQLNDELVKEGGGGSGLQESYEMAALYLLHCLEAPNADRPIVIFFGDEEPYSYISNEQVEELIGVKLPKRITTKEVFKQLMERCEVFLIRKPYGNNANDTTNIIHPEDKQIRATWVGLIGEDRICDLSNPDRVVDVIFGILAQATDKIAYFREEIKGRQTAAQAAEVFKALKTIHGDQPEDGVAGEVVKHKKNSGKKAKPLI